MEIAMCIARGIMIRQFSLPFPLELQFPIWTHLSSPLILERRKLSQKVAWALVASWVVVQVQLMVLFSIPPLARGQNLCFDIAFPPLLVHLICDIACNLLLLGVVVEDS